MTHTAWYAHWFGEDYLKLYPHRDQGEARRAVELVLGRAGLQTNARVLDLACGAGRHLREFARHEVRGFGLDLSFPLLQRAHEVGLPVVRGDMRELPFASGSFGLVTSFFTSFGYFSDPGDDLRVLSEVKRVLRDGGTFAFDFLNADRVRRDLRPRDEREVDGVRVVQSRMLAEGGDVVEKRIEIHDPADRVPRVFYERVRLYAADHLQTLLAREGLEPVYCFGDYTGAPLTPDAPRVMLIGRSV